MEIASNTTHLSEAMLTEIKARLPLRSIYRFKSVCKTWKSTIESVYFRRLFVSLHQNSSSSWSLMRGEFIGKELMGFEGCERHNDLPKSPASYIPPFHDLPARDFATSASSNGLVLMEGTGYRSFVGNPVLQQWVEIHSSPYGSAGLFGLVTRVDEEGVVLSFKVVSFVSESKNCLNMYIYFSETGIWTPKKLHCPCDHIGYSSPMSLNTTLYLSSQSICRSLDPEPGVLLAHDFYSESDQFRVIPLPDHSNHNNNNNNNIIKRALTISGGFVMYIKTLAQKVEDVTLKVWRLNSDDECWQLLWVIGLPLIGNHEPMAMHPLDNGIVYMWNQQSHCLVSCNLRTQNYSILRDESKRQDCFMNQLTIHTKEDCFMNQSICQEYIDDICRVRKVRGATDVIALFHYVLPPWMEPVPCPPQLEIIDTTSFILKVCQCGRQIGEERAKRAKRANGFF